VSIVLIFTAYVSLNNNYDDDVNGDENDGYVICIEIFLVMVRRLVTECHQYN